MDEQFLQEKILELLKKEQMTPTTEIQGLTSINFYKLKKVLQKMQDEGLIESESKGTFTYWKLKKVKK